MRLIEGALAEVTSQRSLLRATTWRSRRKQFLRWTQTVCVLVREEPGRSEGRRPREEEEDGDDDKEEVLGTRARRDSGGGERRSGEVETQPGRGGTALGVPRRPV